MNSDIRPWSGGSTDERAALVQAFLETRRQTERLCEPLETEDYVVQPVEYVSPPKWHLAHTSWFFECFMLQPYAEGYRPYHPAYAYLFNSYYDLVGEHHPRVMRGTASRPTVAEIYGYRTQVTEGTVDLLQKADGEQLNQLAGLVTLGINHEQQHQELLLTDIKQILWCNPLEPVYRDRLEQPRNEARELGWIEVAGSVRDVGFDGGDFCFDNELPRHQALLRDYRIGDRAITNGEYLEFMDDGGYRRSDLWLADGWQSVHEQGWQAPLYWEKRDGEWWCFTLPGMQTVNLGDPVCHISHYEADAYARWAGKRLPTETEWECVAASQSCAGNFVESEQLQPAAAMSGTQFFGDVWEWTASAYLPYPGYRAPEGPVGEYNGKFMSGQMVLRGGSCVTPASHIRASYRNFFQPNLRWQFSGLRLAEDA